MLMPSTHTQKANTSGLADAALHKYCLLNYVSCHYVHAQHSHGDTRSKLPISILHQLHTFKYVAIQAHLVVDPRECCTLHSGDHRMLVTLPSCPHQHHAACCIATRPTAHPKTHASTQNITRVQTGSADDSCVISAGCTNCRLHKQKQ